MTRGRCALVAGAIGLAAGAGTARAEDGLFELHVAGGVSTHRPGEPSVGQTWTVASDLMVRERLGVVGTVDLVIGDRATTVGLGLGGRALVVERFWQRVYLHASPELLLVWPADGPRRQDLAVRAALGYQHLLTWGLGFVVELHGAAPLGVAGGPRFDPAHAGLAAGLFMEF